MAGLLTEFADPAERMMAPRQSASMLSNMMRYRRSPGGSGQVAFLAPPASCADPGTGRKGVVGVPDSGIHERARAAESSSVSDTFRANRA